MTASSIALIAAFFGAIFVLSTYLNSQGAFGGMQIGRLAKNAGFAGDDLLTAVAIAYAESGGDPNARGDRTDPSDPNTATSYGLWQIHFTVHPETYHNNPAELFDPQTNAYAAYMIYVKSGNAFTDWTTYNKGTYIAFLDRAQTEVNV